MRWVQTVAPALTFAIPLEMWLINTQNFSLHEVLEAGDDHPYAILSHTWDEDEFDPLHREITFRDMHSIQEAQKKTGWIKVEQTCSLARQAGLKWAWIDTCCIDKSSSAELSEAINSMFRWYQQATVCFAYLSDLPAASTGQVTHPMDYYLPKCIWFTRGWTLQELIAPSQLQFYDLTWTARGTKQTLKNLISTIAGIDEGVLDGTVVLSDISVAQRMCWASRRKTKRQEDLAYSLLGIFDVNMPLIYGEGMKAFSRLQDMIVQQISDLTLFAWCSHDDAYEKGSSSQLYRGIFAPSPRDFIGCTHIISRKNPLAIEQNTFTNASQHLQFRKDLRVDSIAGDYLLSLGCSDIKSEHGDKVLGIRLVKTTRGYVRHRSDQLVPVAADYTNRLTRMPQENICIPRNLMPSASRQLETRFKDAVKFHTTDEHNISLGYTSALREDLGTHNAYTSVSHLWDCATESFITESSMNFAGIVGFMPNRSSGYTGWADHVRILCGFKIPVQQQVAPDLPRRQSRLKP